MLLRSILFVGETLVVLLTFAGSILTTQIYGISSITSEISKPSLANQSTDTNERGVDISKGPESVVVGNGITIQNTIQCPTNGEGYPLCSGTDQNDKLIGDQGLNFIQGNGGDDIILGYSEKDDLEGGDGNDVIDEGKDADLISGEFGGDYLTGGDGDDLIIGAYYNDSKIIDDSSKDIIACGPGYDTVWINPNEGDNASSDCEVIHNEGQFVGDIAKSHKMTNLTSDK